ncbi:MAG: acylneuraminate cytidylyltransferase family protein [Patescibacteria group bacterium]
MKKPIVKVLGVITARGGSKGIPGKNIKPLLGKPLIAYTIEAAKQSGAIDRLILSTDDEAIAKIGREYGCEVPFMRPKDLAEDKSAHLPVMQHAVRWLKENEKYNPDYVMILQPTSPLRQAFQIKEAVELIKKTGADSVLSVSEIPENFHHRKAMVLDGSGTLKLIMPAGEPIYKRVARRQDLEKSYWSVGSVYLFKTDLLFHSENPNFYGEKTAPLLIDLKYVCDINVPADWDEAEKALHKLGIRN